MSTMRLDASSITTAKATATAKVSHRSGTIGYNGTNSCRLIQFQQRKKKASSMIVCSKNPLASVVDRQGVNESGLSRIESLSQVSGVLGCQWGDEGKGKLVDILAKHFDIVARCQVYLNEFIIGIIISINSTGYLQLCPARRNHLVFCLC